MKNNDDYLLITSVMETLNKVPYPHADKEVGVPYELLERLADRLDYYVGECKWMTNKIESLEDEIVDLEASTDEKEIEVIDLEKEVEDLELEISHLEDKVLELESEVEEIEGMHLAEAKAVYDHELEIDRLKGELDDLNKLLELYREDAAT